MSVIYKIIPVKKYEVFPQGQIPALLYRAVLVLKKDRPYSGKLKNSESETKQ